MIPLRNCWYPPNWGECISDVLGDAVEAALGPFFKLFFDAIKALVVEAVQAVMQAVGFLWITIDSPNVEGNQTVTFVQSHTQYLLVVAASIAVIAGAIKMAVAQRGEPLRDILKSLLTMALVSGAGVGFASLLIQASDAFSEWIIGEALADKTFATKLAEVMVNPLKDEGLGLILVIFIGILMVITSLIQLALMIVRYGMLILLVGVLPLTASATNTEVGMMWFKRAVSWLAGFIIYKPVAALIYAAAIKLVAAPSDSILKTLTGVTMMLMAVVALPALLRFVSPRTA